MTAFVYFIIASCIGWTSCNHVLRNCVDWQKTFEEREEEANVVMTGTVKNLFPDVEHPKMYRGDVEIKRVIKGTNMITRLPGLHSPFYRKMVTVDGFGDPHICDSDIHKYDTRIFMLSLLKNGHLKLNSSLERITYNNLNRADAAVQNVPYKAKPPPPEAPCEKLFCAYGAECLVNSTSKQAYCACMDNCGDLFTPVCGSDDVTYASECELRKTSCKAQKRIKVKVNRQCDIKDPCENKECSFGAECVPSIDGLTAKCQCPDQCDDFGDTVDSSPVCGDDGRDYANQCEMRRTACHHMKEIRMKYMGKCDPCRDIQCRQGTVCLLDMNRKPTCQCNSRCSNDFAPVCGSDGNTYSSECQLNNEACKQRKDLRVLFRGECHTGFNPCKKLSCSNGTECYVNMQGDATCVCPPPCEKVLRPVCGSDGITYDNECELKRKACLEQRTVKLENYAPCAVDGPCTNFKCTFGATCAVKDGHPSCKCPQCPPTFEPVCGTDGVAYENECELKAERCAKKQNINVKYRGLCTEGCENKKCDFYSSCQISEGQAVCECPSKCVKTEDKVCGTDDVTYMNECELRVASCKKQQFIIVASHGACNACHDVRCPVGSRCENGECVCIKECADTDDPVCGSDEKTYINECEMKRQACMAEKDVEVVHAGECREVGSGTDGSGMQNCDDTTCQFGGMCIPDDDGNLVCRCKFNCLALRSPVCGSDGTKYGNECELKEASCKQQKAITTQPMENCDDIEMGFCDGGDPVRDPLTGTELDCTNDKSVCPQGSYCHEIGSRGQCCQGEKPVIKSCADTKYGCCPDGKTESPGPDASGCPSACMCNQLGSYKETCNPTTMQCVCKPGVGGKRCDRCEPGYWGLPLIKEGHTGCLPCRCNHQGSVRDDCEQMTGRCMCKEGITGQKCDVCADGQIMGPEGCTTGHRRFALRMLRDDESKYLTENIKGPRSTCADIKCHYGAKCEEENGVAECKCLHTCPTDGPPVLVCATDGQTFTSTCQLERFACRLQKDIKVAYQGACHEKTTSPPSRTRKTTRHVDGRNKNILGTPPYGIINDFCDDDRDCVVVNSFCRDGMCACKEGYLATKQNKICQASGCDPNPCLSGGKCVLNKSGTYRCECPLGKGGLICDSETSLPVPSISDITTQLPITVINTTKVINSSITPSNLQLSGVGTEVFKTESTTDVQAMASHTNTQSLSTAERAFTVPSFSGTSYLTLHRTHRVHQLTTIEMTFNPLNRDGILLYSGQSDDGKGDFISLSLVDGYVVFRYDLGSGPSKLVSKETLTLGKPHKVIAKRTGSMGSLQVDNQEEVKGQSPGTLKSLNLLTPLYMGYVPTQIQVIFKEIGTDMGFVGCIEDLRIEGANTDRVYDLAYPTATDIIQGWDIGECGSSPCSGLPCKNHGTCMKLDKQTYKCLCQKNFSGENCEIDLTQPCSSKPCQAGGKCIDHKNSTFSCICSQERRGKLCDKDLKELKDITVPLFRGDSYLEIPLESNMAKSLHFELWFLTTEPNGVLLYAGQREDGAGDFISLNLVHGRLQFTFDLGSGMANITSSSMVSLNTWHKVTITRTNKLGSLSLDDKTPKDVGESGGSLQELNLDGTVFIGKVRDTPNINAGVTTGFTGAIQRIYEDKQLRDDWPVSVKDFNHITQYDGPPCLSAGSPCANGGTCIPNFNDFVCVCPKEYTGKKCKRKVISGHLDKPLLFDGRTNMRYMNTGDKKVKGQKENRFSFRIRTTSPQGLILLQKKSQTVAGDYLAITLSQGYVEVSYNLGRQGLANMHYISSDHKVNDGQWHTITFTREKRKGTLQVDTNKPVTEVSTQGSTQLDTDGYLWLGGNGAPPEGLPEAYRTGFKGCLEAVSVDDVRINLAKYLNMHGTLQFCDF